MKLASKISLIAVAVVAVAVVAVTFLADRILAGILTSQIAAKTGLETQLASAHLEFWPSLRVNAQGLELRKPNAPGEAPVISVDAFGFTLPYNVLIGRTPQLSDISVTHPMVRVEAAAHAIHPASPAGDADAVFNGPLTVTDGVIINEIPRRHITGRIEGVTLRAQETREGAFVMSLDAKLIGKTLHADVRAPSAADLRAGRTTRFDVAASADPHATASLKFRTDVRASSEGIAFENVTGTWQNSALNASATVRFGDEVPVVAANLQVDRVDLSGIDTGRPSADAPLSDATMDLTAMRLVDAKIDLKADSLRAGNINVANVVIKTTLDNGVLRVGLNPVDFYQGKVAANFGVDASQDTPTETAKIALTNVKAGAFFADLAGMKQFEGTLQFNADLSSTGTSPKAIVGNLTGTADIAAKDGVITGHKLPSMFREVSTYLPSAWRSLSDRIIITSLTTKLNIAQGVATSNNIRILSPVADITGKGDVNLVDRTLNLRFDPKVSSGSKSASPIDLGAAILVSGSWSDPKVSADLSSLMSDPSKAMDKLQDLGSQFLGGDSSKPGRKGGDDIMKGLGGLLKGFSDNNRR